MKLATLCYIVRDGRTLMLHRNPKPGMRGGRWNGLGGKLEPGESPEQCVVREVREESGLTVLDPRLRALLTFPADPHTGGEDWYVVVYTATRTSGELQAQTEEGALEWVEDARLPSLEVFEGDRIFLPLLLDPETPVFSAVFRYDAADHLVSHEVVLHGAR